MKYTVPTYLFVPAALVCLAGVLLSTGVRAATDPGARTVPAPGEEVDEVVTVAVEGSTLEYQTTELRLVAGTTVTLRLNNTKSTMPHNVVLLKDQGDIRTVGIAALQAQATDYVPESQSDKIIGHTALAPPGEVVEFTFVVPPPGEYPYVCTYPGHFQTMRGTLISVESK